MKITTQMMQDAFEMFLFLSVELTVLFLGISYAVGVLQEYLPPDRVKTILSSQNSRGYLLAALLGAITPFCSCSTIPFLKGMLRARVDFGTMIVFLFASPLLNPIVIGLLVFTFGAQVAVFYFVMAMSVSMAAGYLFEKLGFDAFIKPEVFVVPQQKNAQNRCDVNSTPESLWKKVWYVTWLDFKKVLPYLLVSIAVGSIIYGFVPTEFISNMAAEDNPLAVPIAATVGIPLYIRASTVIPISAALAAKGMSLGAVMALIIGSAGASLTEVILLKSLFMNRLILAFLVVVLSMAIMAGYLYNTIF
ncbi:MAG: permease [Arenicella sp.]